MSELMINIVTSGQSWFAPYAKRLLTLLQGHQNYSVQLLDCHQLVKPGTYVSFFLSYPKKVPVNIRANSLYNIVVHASDLPEGKGWSPWVWSILENKDEITLSLFEMEEDVDSGPIYFKEKLMFTGSELLEEIRGKLAEMIIKMVLKFLMLCSGGGLNYNYQIGKSSYFRKRTTDDSRLDPYKTIADQFNLLRVVDNERYPAFFDYRGVRYLVKIYLDKGDGGDEN